MQVINKRIIVIFICLIIFIFGLFKLFNKKEIELDNVILDINNSKDSLAIYIEKYDDNGNASYVESEDNTFPIENYVYNKELSGCLDSNSNEVNDALKYDYVNKELNLRVNKPVTCYVYYDYKGNGTEKIPYKIRSIEDLLDLSRAVNSGTNYANTYFELTRDLDFNDKNSYNDSERTDYGNLNGIDDNNTLMKELTTGTGWVPIGETTSSMFEGIFDGNNKRIDNFYQKRNKEGGLFLIINNAVLKNLTLSGDVTVSEANTGGLVAATYGNTTITNCHNEANVTSLASSGASAGGITGGSSGGKLVIKNSSNKGNISGSNNTGGLIGAYLYDLTIEDSYNEGIVTNSLGLHAGGLVGRDDSVSNNAIILNSYNSGKVIIGGTSRTTHSGGLVGKIIGKIYVNNSYNKGEIITDLNSIETIAVYLGGLIGYDGGKAIITNSYNNANVTGGNRVGGLVGMAYGTAKNTIMIIDKSYNTGNLSPSKNSNWTGGIFVGGITSFVWNEAEVYVFNSYNASKMETNSSFRQGVAGLVARVDGSNTNGQKVSIVNSYNMGNILNSSLGMGFSELSTGTLKLDNVYSNINFDNVVTKYGIGNLRVNNYNITKAYYKNTDNISGSNIENNEIIGKDLSYMQSETFVNELNNNTSNIKLTDYIDSSLLTEFKNTTGYDLTLSEWKLKDNYPVLVSLEGIQ